MHVACRRLVGSLILTFATLAGPARGAEPAARAVLMAHCGRCHGPGGTGKGGFGYLLDRDRLVARGQVVPGRPEDSPLFGRVRDGDMPPAGKRPGPTAAERAVLRRWIEAGAPPLEAVAAADAPRDVAGVLHVVLADLHALEPRRRRFARYLTVAHLAHAGLSARSLDTARHALAKLVNSLSWHPRITRLLPLDPARTVFRLDLRDYRWSARTWDRLAAAYPYRLPDGPALEAVAALAGAPRPVLRGDWFAATASRPPFYHDFLQMPATDRALERLLQVDVHANLRDDAVARAGFNGSGVARHNRVIERHDAAHGAYWRSYDFRDGTGRQNVFERPLGPLPGPLGFTHAGGEIVFHLPNGLQGYLLVDADGRRIDKAPGEIVSDPRRPDRLVENGLSCHSCHVRGLLPKDDQVRAHALHNATAFRPADREAVLALYPPAARLRALMRADMERFARALGGAGVPEGDPEPVSAVVLRYEGVLDLATAAAEAGLPAVELADRLRRSPERARSLGALLARGGTVQREVWEEAFADLARAFRLGGTADAAAAVKERPDVLRGHEGPVRALAFAPDGRTAASGGADRTVRVWDLATGRARLSLNKHTDEVEAVAFVGGRLLASAGADRTVRVWDLESGRVLHGLVGHTDAVRALAATPDGKLLLSGGADRTIRVWDLATGREVCCLSGHAGAITAVACAPAGRLALSGGADHSVRLWDLASGRERGRWAGHTATVHAVAFSPDGRRALSGGGDRCVILWDVATGKELRRFTGHANAVVRVAFSPEGRYALSGSSQYQAEDPRAVRVWDTERGTEAGGLAGGRLGRVECLAFSADGGRVLTSQAGVLRLWPLTRP